MMGLTPEMLDRLKRIAKAQSKTLGQVLCDAVQELLGQVRDEEPAQARRMVDFARAGHGAQGDPATGLR